MRTTVIAWLTFQEAARRRILLAALVFGLLFLAVYALGFHFVQTELEAEMQGPRRTLEMNEIHNFLLLAGLYAVNFLTIMMTVLTSVDTLSGEIGSGTIHTLLSKPLRRREVLLGKWLGFAGMLTLYLLMMAGGVMMIVYLRGGYVANNLLQGLGLLWLNSLVLLSVSLLGGAMLSTLANGVIVFGLFGVAFIGGWIEHIGSFLQNETAINIGVVSSLLLPSEALWKRLAFEMQSPLVAAIGFSPFSAASVPSPVMVWYALVYIGVMLLLAMWQFEQRDL